MAEIESFGTKAGLKDGPRTVEPGRGSSGTREDFGTGAPLSNTAASNKFSTGGGTMQLSDTKANLSNTVSKGYTSASTPLSKRTVAQSK